MKGGRVLATVTDYPGLLAAMRDRAAEREIAIGSDEVHALAGLADRSIPKLLSQRTLKSMKSARRVGMLTLGPLLEMLGIKLVVVEDQEAIARFEERARMRLGSPLRKRNPSFVRPRRSECSRVDAS
jgi:hypothetical protein